MVYVFGGGWVGRMGGWSPEEWDEMGGGYVGEGVAEEMEGVGLGSLEGWAGLKPIEVEIDSSCKFKFRFYNVFFN